MGRFGGERRACSRWEHPCRFTHQASALIDASPTRESPTTAHQGVRLSRVITDPEAAYECATREAGLVTWRPVPPDEKPNLVALRDARERAVAQLSDAFANDLRRGSGSRPRRHAGDIGHPDSPRPLVLAIAPN